MYILTYTIWKQIPAQRFKEIVYSNRHETYITLHAFDTYEDTKEDFFVTDGGYMYLIQKLNLPRGKTYDQICEMYIDYVQKKYPNSTIVFDG